MQICKDAMQHIHFVCSTFAKIWITFQF
jgi:hypothetical protein